MDGRYAGIFLWITAGECRVAGGLLLSVGSRKTDGKIRQQAEF